MGGLRRLSCVLTKKQLEEVRGQGRIEGHPVVWILERCSFVTMVGDCGTFKGWDGWRLVDVFRSERDAKTKRASLGKAHRETGMKTRFRITWTVL